MILRSAGYLRRRLLSDKPRIKIGDVSAELRWVSELMNSVFDWLKERQFDWPTASSSEHHFETHAKNTKKSGIGSPGLC